MPDQAASLGQDQPRILAGQADGDPFGHRIERLGHDVGAAHLQQPPDRGPLLGPHVRTERAAHLAGRFQVAARLLVPLLGRRRAELLQQLQLEVILQHLVVPVADPVLVC